MSFNYNLMIAILGLFFSIGLNADVVNPKTIKNIPKSVYNLQLQNSLVVEVDADQLLKERIQQQLRSNIVNYNPNTLNITCSNKKIIIEGYVSNAELASKIETLISQVQGVEVIQNNLLVQF